MAPATPYPVDYQLALERTLRTRLEAVRAAGRAFEACILEDTLARLWTAEFGACLACGNVIPFLELAADPTRQICRSCAGGNENAARRLCSSTS
jgi:RNA polymerase-binding transcription factor DksA